MSTPRRIVVDYTVVSGESHVSLETGVQHLVRQGDWEPHGSATFAEGLALQPMVQIEWVEDEDESDLSSE